MNLRRLAEQDLGQIIENATTGFGWVMSLTSPDGVTSPMTGLSNDIALAIDPDTGVLISGRTVSIALRLSSLRAAGFPDNPKNIVDQNKKPWIVGFKDINDVPTLFKVIKSNPDRAIGAITLILETYKQALFYNGAWTFDGANQYDGVLKYL